MNFTEAHREFNFVEMNSLSDLDKQYKFLAKKRHPDVGGSSISFQTLINAKDVLESHIKTYKTTSYRRETKIPNSVYKNSSNNKEDISLYDCTPFVQKKSFFISLIYLFCFFAKIKVKKINGFTFVFIKDKKIILTKKEDAAEKLSIKLNNFKRVPFLSKKNKIEIYPQIYIWFI